MLATAPYSYCVLYCYFLLSIILYPPEYVERGCQALVEYMTDLWSCFSCTPHSLPSCIGNWRWIRCDTVSRIIPRLPILAIGNSQQALTRKLSNLFQKSRLLSTLSTRTNKVILISLPQQIWYDIKCSYFGFYGYSLNHPISTVVSALRGARRLRTVTFGLCKSSVPVSVLHLDRTIYFREKKILFF